MSHATTMRSVGLLYKASSPDAKALRGELSAWLFNQGLTVHCLNDLPVDTSAEEVLDSLDLVLSLGGDGTLIHTVKLLDGRTVPLLGINMGTLGFLTEINRDEARDTLALILRGDFRMITRTMLYAELLRQDQTEPVLTGYVLNDVVVNKSVLARLILVDAYADDEFVSRYRGDGLIVATPTGSTAYNLAANGPILPPTMKAMVLSPICPHSFANRPLVVPHETRISLRLVDPADDVFLTIDGQVGCEMKAGDEIRIGWSERVVNVVRHPSRSYYELLHHKLGWGVH